MQHHGGDIDAAMRRFGWAREDWIDLSTGINRAPYPLPAIGAEAWRGLPTSSDIEALHRAAQRAYGTNASVVAVSGAQAAIQLVPRLMKPGEARVLAPTYVEHAEALRAAGWTVREVGRPEELAGANLAMIVNPNNPDGRVSDPAALVELSRHVGRLVVDESFADPVPHLSLAPRAAEERIIILRSFGKFYGLAGLRLGFAIGAQSDISLLAKLAGPWPVSGPAIAIGTAALSDTGWQAETSARLACDCTRLDALASGVGWRLEGGTHLFRLFDAGHGLAAQERLARHRIWSRVFPWSQGGIRLGLPGCEREWQRLERALDR